MRYKFIFIVIDMNITEYRLNSMDEPFDELLHELMEQVAETARQSTANANRILRQKLEETIELIKSNRQITV